MQFYTLITFHLKILICLRKNHHFQIQNGSHEKYENNQLLLNYQHFLKTQKQNLYVKIYLFGKF